VLLRPPWSQKQRVTLADRDCTVKTYQKRKENNLSDQKPFAGRVAIVTGGTRGIGRAIAVELAKRGADIAFNYAKSAEAAEALKPELESLGVRVL